MRLRVDRGTLRGAKRVIVTKDLCVIDHDLAKKHGIVGEYFQSKAEALRYVGLSQLERAGVVRGLRRQVHYPLNVTRPDGIVVRIGNYIADFVYDERDGDGWHEVIEDVKGNPEDLYKWKKRHVESQYGVRLREHKAWRR